MQGGNKPFSCPMCGSQFYFSTRMKEPTSRVHEGTKPFLCDSCEESFDKDFKLKLHIKGMKGGKSSFHVLCGTQTIHLFSHNYESHIPFISYLHVGVCMHMMQLICRFCTLTTSPVCANVNVPYPGFTSPQLSTIPMGCPTWAMRMKLL